MIRKGKAIVCLGAVLCFGAAAADPPQAEIRNSQIKAKLYLPDSANGFYRGTRFDWSGVIYSLEYAGHNYYGPWFAKMDPTVRDYVYQDIGVVAGRNSAIAGPAEEFQRPLGFDAAKPGGTFIKVGVGVLRKPDNAAYSSTGSYEIVDGGKWRVEKGADFVAFTQELAEPASGYGYTYRKVVRLTSGKPEMTIEHSLKNTGRTAIQTNVYNHNFLVLDGVAPGPDFDISVPFQVKSSRPPDAQVARVVGNRIEYRKKLEGEDRMQLPVEGFGSASSDYDIRIDNRKVGVGMRIRGDRPLSRVNFWSIRTNLSMEPFIDVAIDPQKEFTWKITYEFYTLAK